MSQIIGLSGSPSRSSRTKIIVEAVAAAIAERAGGAYRTIDIADYVCDLGVASRNAASPRLEEALKAIETASLLIVGSPVYKGSYAGLLKHMIDLLDYPILQGTPVGLLATGGSERHALMVEYQLRPLFSFFCAHTLPTGVFVADSDIVDGKIKNGIVDARLQQLIEEGVKAMENARRSKPA